MTATVTREEAQLQTAELGEQDIIGRLAPGSPDTPPLGVFDAGQVVETGPADDAEHRFHA